MNQLGKLIKQLISNSDSLVKSEIQDKFSKNKDRRILRKVPITHAADMVGVSRQRIYTAHKDGKLPGELFDDWDTGAGLDLYQIDAMRDIFGTRPKTSRAIVEAISGHKGGGHKTTTALHQAQWHAMKGYRTLLISMDPQGSLNLAMGMLPDVDIKADDTLLPYFLGQHETAHYAIKKTYFPSLDIIPSCLQLARVDDEVAALGDKGLTRTQVHMLLRDAIESIMDDYDLIIIDCPPNLGLGTVMCVFAADVLIIPSPVDRFGFYSTRQYLKMLDDLLMPFGEADFYPSLKILGTHYDPAPGSNSEAFFAKMKKAWGAAMLNYPLKKTNQVPVAYDKMRTIYEQEPQERTSWNAYKKAVCIFDDLFNEIEQTLLIPTWRAE
ncbi:MAG: plasmid-partitioning protein SopA [Shewanella algae]